MQHARIALFLLSSLLPALAYPPSRQRPQSSPDPAGRTLILSLYNRTHWPCTFTFEPAKDGQGNPVITLGQTTRSPLSYPVQPGSPLTVVLHLARIPGRSYLKDEGFPFIARVGEARTELILMNGQSRNGLKQGEVQGGGGGSLWLQAEEGAQVLWYLPSTQESVAKDGQP